MDGTTGNVLSTPIRRAMLTTRSGPTSSVIWMYTELSDDSVARAMGVAPR